MSTHRGLSAMALTGVGEVDENDVELVSLASRRGEFPARDSSELVSSSVSESQELPEAECPKYEELSEPSAGSASS